MSKKKSVIKLFFIFFLFVFAGNYAFAADSSESCSNYDALQYKPDGACGTKQRTCCSSSGKWSNWGEDCTCGNNECYNPYSKQCAERCTEGKSEAKSSKCNYHGTYSMACTYGPSSICKTFVTSAKPCKCDKGYTGTYCDKKAVTADTIWLNAAVQSNYSGGGYSMFAFVCDNLINHSVPSYPPGTYVTTYSCGDGGNYSVSGQRTTSGSQAALNNLHSNFCKMSSGGVQALCEEKGAGYNCVASINNLHWDDSGYYETMAQVIRCKEAI